MIDTKSLKSDFDLKSFLDDYDIPYAEEGDNVTPGWINIDCFYCGDNDKHLGINIDSKYANCWKCKEGGDIITIIRDLLEFSYSKTVKILKEYQIKTFRKSSKKVKKELNENNNIEMPEGSERLTGKGNLPRLVKKYLKKRNFNPTIIRDYNLYFSKYGKFNNRLIVPVFYKSYLVSYQAVDLTGKANSPYIDCSKRNAVIYNKHMVYGIDDIYGSQLVIVEGITDRWRIGKNYSVALFGKNFSREQLLLIIENVEKDVLIKCLFDPDASKENRKMAVELCCFFNKVLFIDLEKQGIDPAMLKRKEVNDILRLK